MVRTAEPTRPGTSGGFEPVKSYFHKCYAEAPAARYGLVASS